MQYDTLLILDLDDTLFETKTIEQHHVAPAIDAFISHASDYFDSNQIDSILEDLWKLPFDTVSSKYAFSNSLNHLFISKINSLEYKLDIQPFEDVHFVREIKASKILVTTGFQKLQHAKINALGFDNSFKEIHIDAIDDPNRKYKKGIFEELLNHHEYLNKRILVLGDNPLSELKAGRELGLSTIQVAKLDQPKSEYADHYITHFSELSQLIDASVRPG